MGLVDIPVLGKKFTWISSDGRLMSRLDCLLQSKDLINLLKISSQWVGARELSDHSPKVLRGEILNWGAKPFKLFNFWMDHNDFKKLISECWEQTRVSGWKIFSFHQKLKALKSKLKSWSKDTFGLEELRVQIKVEELDELDNQLLDGHSNLATERLDAVKKLWGLIRIKECSALQKIQSEMDTAWVFKLEVLPFLYEVQDQE